MTERAKRGAAYADIERAPDDRIAELVLGDLYLSPRPSLRHALAASALVTLLGDAFHFGRSGPGGWWILFEPEVRSWGDVLVPDIAGWRREHLAAIPDGVGIHLPPDWVCEVLSQSTELFDRNQKLPRYADLGVKHLWLVDPAARRVEVYERAGLVWARLEVHGADAVISAPPFEAVPLELLSLWG
ncbi:MAG: Uma2 family endonuclease [Thermoanaerobaculia bacterium]